MVGVEDVELLVKAAAGDADAVRRFIDATGATVFGYVLARVGGDRAAADDVVQDAFLEAIRSAPTYRGDSALTTWMCTIARRRLARYFEAERRHADAALDVVGEAREAEDLQPAIDERDEIVRALGRLPVLHRQVLVRKYLDDTPVADIAAELGRTAIQVQSLLQRARDGLRRELEAMA